jgi:hypothetical protein
MTSTERWPALPFEEWRETCDTLHLWTQMVGKVKLELAPFQNEWWEVAFHPAARGLTSGLIPYHERAFEVLFDFVDHKLVIQMDDGNSASMALLARPVAEFYEEFMELIHSRDIPVTINPLPAEVPDPIPFDQDRTHASYQPEYVQRWWRILLQTVLVLQRYCAPFAGKSSPIQFFWGSFDLNVARFSGRPAKPPEGPLFFRLAEDQENISCGFWPGNTSASGVTLGEPAFYSYIYPAPDGYAQSRVFPAAAYFDARLGEFVLRYEDARRSRDPAGAILDFFNSTYEAAANAAGWDRAHLERKPPRIAGEQNR